MPGMNVENWIFFPAVKVGLHGSTKFNATAARPAG